MFDLIVYLQHVSMVCLLGTNETIIIITFDVSFVHSFYYHDMVFFSVKGKKISNTNSNYGNYEKASQTKSENIKLQ